MVRIRSFARESRWILVAVVFGAAWCTAFAETTTCNVDTFHLTSPFWKTDTSFDEGITFIQSSGAAPADARLLFKPSKVLLARNASRTITYAYGTDFTIDTAGKRIVLTSNSRIPYGPLPGGENHDNHLRQQIITYTHTDTWPRTIGQFAGSALPLTTGKLRNGQPITFAIMGTSISWGFNASGMDIPSPVSPYQPSCGWLLAALLHYRYGSTITYKNYGVSTVASNYGVQIAPTVANDHPDLVIIEYGMNECWDPADTVKAHVASIMSIIKGIHSATEFIIEGSTLPRSDWQNCNASLPLKRDAEKLLGGPGVAFADVTQLWSDILQRKRYEDMTGNNINHPNDWAHRLLAQAPMELLYSSATSAEIPKRNADANQRTPRAVFSSGRIVVVNSSLEDRSSGTLDSQSEIFDIRGRSIRSFGSTPHSAGVRVVAAAQARIQGR